MKERYYILIEIIRFLPGDLRRKITSEIRSPRKWIATKGHFEVTHFRSDRSSNDLFDIENHYRRDPFSNSNPIHFNNYKK